MSGRMEGVTRRELVVVGGEKGGARRPTSMQADAPKLASSKGMSDLVI